MLLEQAQSFIVQRSLGEKLRWLYDQQQHLPLPDNVAKVAKELARRLDGKQQSERVPLLEEN